MFDDLKVNVWEEIYLDRKSNPWRDGSAREPMPDVKLQKFLKISAPQQMRAIYSMAKSRRKDTPMQTIMSASGAETQYALLVDWYKLTGVLPKQPRNSWHKKLTHLAPRMKELRAAGMSYVDIGILLNVGPVAVRNYCLDHPCSAYTDKEKALAKKIFGKWISHLTVKQRRQISELAKREGV